MVFECWPMGFAKNYCLGAEHLQKSQALVPAGVWKQVVACLSAQPFCNGGFMEQMGHLVLSRSVARISAHSCHRLVYKLSEHAVLAETNILDPSYQRNWHKLSPNI